ncbi:MAG: hypothetical protein KatS3mg058_0875 [Roseiflexus sp.]|nr:MAG: hypothetical protein KatS3mg058_0875 [Roseiflexus sp.]
MNHRTILRWLLVVSVVGGGPVEREYRSHCTNANDHGTAINDHGTAINSHTSAYIVLTAVAGRHGHCGG